MPFLALVAAGMRRIAADVKAANGAERLGGRARTTPCRLGSRSRFCDVCVCERCERRRRTTVCRATFTVLNKVVLRFCVERVCPAETRDSVVRRAKLFLSSRTRDQKRRAQQERESEATHQDVIAPVAVIIASYPAPDSTPPPPLV